MIGTNTKKGNTKSKENLLNLSEELLQGISEYELGKLTPFQEQLILSILEGKDTMSQAFAGTGKTTAFTIAILNMIDSNIPKCQGIVICPTREIAYQTCTLTNALGKYTNINAPSLVGGVKLKEDINYITQSRINLIIGTPGRIFDFIRRGILKVDAVKIIIIDEAEEVMSRGFKDTLTQIFQYISQTAQICVLSNAFPASLIEFSENFMQNPFKVFKEYSDN